MVNVVVPSVVGFFVVKIVLFKEAAGDTLICMDNDFTDLTRCNTIAVGVNDIKVKLR